MARPRKRPNGLPSYCYKDPKNGAYYMLAPAPGVKLTRRTYGDDLHRMLDDWARSWGASLRLGDTVGAAIDLYLGVLAQRRKAGEIQESTEKDYRKHLAKLKQVFGTVRLIDVDVPMLVRWRDVRASRSATQFNLERTALLETFKVAVERGMVKANPVTLLGRAKTRPRDQYVTNDDVNRVINCAGQVVQAAAVLAVSTGLRQGDILRLKIADFDESGLTVKPNKTKGRTRKALHIPWSEGMRLACRLAARKVTTIDGFWLTTEEGGPYTSSGFRSLWWRAMKKAREKHPDMAQFTFNDLRAKAGTDGEDWGLLGHLDQKTHSRIYDRKPRVVKPAR